MANVTLTAATDFALVPTVSASRITTYVAPDGSLSSIYIREAHKSRELRNDSTTYEFTRVYYIHGTDDPAQCADLGPKIGSQDTVIAGLYATNRTMSPHASGGGSSSVVRLDVTFSQPDAATGDGQVADTNFSYEFGGETEHIEVALSQQAYPTQSNKVDAGIIGFNGESIDGVDISAPVIEFTEEWIFTPAQFSPFYRKILYLISWTSNGTAFREYAAGEVLFAGASATKRNGFWYVTFRFRVHRNIQQSILTSSGTVEVIKGGWEYMWFEYENVPGSSSSQPIKQSIKAAYVAKVYKSSDFNSLGIGTQARS